MSAGSDAPQLGEQAAAWLARSGQVRIGPGLTSAEFARVEHDYGFEFADDHRAFLAAGLPLNSPPEPGQTWARPWPDWRDGDPGELREQVSWAVDGVLFDVEHNGHWHRSWGRRPADAAQALDVARRHLVMAPKMVPVYAHRYLPGGRATHGHPVLSIWQTDMIIYGTDLADYVEREFSDPGSRPSLVLDPARPMVPFWREYL